MILNMVGYTGVNFAVTGGTTQPAAPGENTLWISTETGVTQWVFRGTEPETAAEGMVWFCTGVSGGLEFNALKTNGIQLNVVGCKQYLTDTWQEKELRIYQSGAWQEMEA